MDEKKKVILKLDNICQSYVVGESVKDAVENVSLEVYDNEFLVILGPGHCGKTVLKMCIRDSFTPVSGHNLMRTKFDEIGMHMEEKMGHSFFCCDAVLDTYSRQIAIFSGYAKEMQPVSWDVADKRTYVPWAEKKYDVVVFGLSLIHI